MKITGRQEDILEKIIREYITEAEPVSSQFLEKKYGFGLSPATIRAEMHRLEKEGFLFQPHASSGRVPTDRGYRFFVDMLTQEDLMKDDFHFTIEENFNDIENDLLRITQSLTRHLSEVSSGLAISYLAHEKILWKEGWEGVLEEPEFQERKMVFELVKFIREFEKNIENLRSESAIDVYIGRENPFFRTREFTLIYSRCALPQGKELIISILGPKRMEYDKNIGLINSLKQFFTIKK